VIFVVRREMNMLTKIERREKRQKLRGESVCRIIDMNVKVTGDDKFMGCGCSGGEKRTEVICCLLLSICSSADMILITGQ